MQCSVEARAENLDRVNGFIHSALEGRDVPGGLLGAIDLAVEEIFVNIASYAYRPGTGSVTIDCTVPDTGDEVSICFTDAGVPFNPMAQAEPDITQDAAERCIGGLGIFLAKKYMDGIAYRHEDGKNILTIRKRLRPAAQDGA